MEKILVKSLTKEVLDLCKSNTKEEKLMFVNLGRDQFIGNTYILNKYFRNENKQACYYANLLYFRNIQGITLIDIKKELRKDFGQEVSLAGYKYKSEHYVFWDVYEQDEYEEDLFRYKDNEDEELELEYERRHPNIETLDFEVLESLYNVYFKALKKRYLMLFHLEDIPAILNNAIECYYTGTNVGPSNYVMHSKIAELKTILEDKETIEWLKTGPSDLSFDKQDYIDTYQKSLRQLTKCNDEDKEYLRDLIHNPEDLWEEEILNMSNYVEEVYIDNMDFDENEDMLD